MVHDIRYAIRQLRRAPGYAALAIATMALGIGATTTLFNVAYSVLLKPLPWPEADRLVRVTETRKGQAARIRGTISNGSYLAWRDHPATIEAIAAYMTTTITAMPRGGEPARVQIARVTPSAFPMLRVQPARGRVFRDDEAPAGGSGAASASPVVILSYGLWQQWFGGRDEAISAPMSFPIARRARGCRWRSATCSAIEASAASRFLRRSRACVRALRRRTRRPKGRRGRASRRIPASPRSACSGVTRRPISPRRRQLRR